MAYAGKTGESADLAPVTLPVSQPMSPLATGIAIGIVVGVGAALLLAPYEGRDSRRKIRRHLRRAGWRGRDAWDELRYELLRARRQLKRARLKATLKAEKAAVEAITPL